MSPRRIVLSVKTDGTIVAETKGVEGPACMDALPLIESLCKGAAVVHSRLTKDYYVNEPSRVRDTERNEQRLGGSDEA